MHTVEFLKNNNFFGEMIFSIASHVTRWVRISHIHTSLGPHLFVSMTHFINSHKTSMTKILSTVRLFQCLSISIPRQIIYWKSVDRCLISMYINQCLFYYFILSIPHYTVSNTIFYKWIHISMPHNIILIISMPHLY